MAINLALAVVVAAGWLRFYLRENVERKSGDTKLQRHEIWTLIVLRPALGGFGSK